APAARGREPRTVAAEVAVGRAPAGRMSDKDETATYVYCLVQRARAPVLTRAPRGLPGTGRLRALDTGEGLWLVVAQAPLARDRRDQFGHAVSRLEEGAAAGGTRGAGARP